MNNDKAATADEDKAKRFEKPATVTENDVDSRPDPPPTHEEIDRRLCRAKLCTFAEQLQESTRGFFPNTSTSRYQNVHVLMLKWEDEDPNLPVSIEISKLKDVFANVYHFNTDVWDIPDEDCHDKVNQKILDFSRMGSKRKDDLMILYYGGHGKLTRNRSLAWTSWRNAGRSECPAVKWSGIQNVLEEAHSDVLLLLDCCHSGTSNTNEGRGLTELISSCDYRSIANGVGPFSFTQALVTELLIMAKMPRFSVSDLYNNIYFRIQGRMPEDSRERHPAPVHLLLASDNPFRQSIQLSIQPDPNERQNFMPTDPISMAGSKGAHEHFEPEIIAPRIALGIKFDDSFTKEEPPVRLFAEWLRCIPGIAHSVKIEAGLEHFYPSLINTEPRSLPGARAPFIPPLTTASERKHVKKPREYPAAVSGNLQSPNFQHVSTFDRPSVNFKLPPNMHVKTPNYPPQYTPHFQHPSKFNGPPASFQPQQSCGFPISSHPTAQMTIKYFPDLRSQYRLEKPHDINSGEIENLGDLGAVFLGAILLCAGPAYIIWTLVDISIHGLTYSYSNLLVMGFILHIISIAICAAILIVGGVQDLDDPSTGYMHFTKCIFWYSYFMVIVFSLLTLPIWGLWSLGKLCGFY